MKTNSKKEYEALQDQIEHVDLLHKNELRDLREHQKKTSARLRQKATRARKDYRLIEWQNFLFHSLTEMAQGLEDQPADKNHYNSYETSPRLAELPNVGENNFHLKLTCGGGKGSSYSTYSLRVCAIYTLRRQGYVPKGQEFFKSSLDRHIAGNELHLRAPRDNWPTRQDVIAWLRQLAEKAKDGDLPACPCRLQTKVKYK